jgi:adhesin/invasin
LTNTKAGLSTVTATVNGRDSTVDTTFVANADSAEIAEGNLLVTTNGAVASGQAQNAVTATVTDTNGNRVPNVVVNFVATNGAEITASVTTDAQGVASTTLTNTKAGLSTVTATVNGRDSTVDTTFVADVKTAVMTSATVTDNSAANDSTPNSMTFTLRDGRNNPLPGVALTLSASDKAKIVSTDHTTDASGTVTVQVTSVKAGMSRVTATAPAAKEATATQNTTFVADVSTAKIKSLTIPGAVQSVGYNRRSVEVIVEDINGNPVSNYPVNFEADDPVTATVSPSIYSTNNAGVIEGYAVEMSSRKAGINFVRASTKNNTLQAGVEFRALVKTARENSFWQQGGPREMKLILRDRYENPLIGVGVEFEASSEIFDAKNTWGSSFISYKKYAESNDKGEIELPISSKVNPDGVVVKAALTLLNYTELKPVTFKSRHRR